MKYLQEFHDRLPKERLTDLKTKPWNEVLKFNTLLIAEESEEVCETTFDETDREMYLKELGDLLYVTLGSFHRIGASPAHVLQRIHASNMTKFEGGGEFNEDGKLLKGPAYRDPDLSGL